MSIEAREHPMVQAAVARLAGHGGWARMVAGEPLSERIDLVDADLLAAAGVVRRRPDGSYEVLDENLALMADPDVIAHNVLAHLRRALRHAEGGSLGWVDDPEVMRAQGRGSAVVADVMRAHLLPLMPSSRDALEAGGRFLDVGTGVGAIAARMCELHPGSTATGIDVSEVVLGLAREEIAARGLDDRVELRLQSVADLDDVEAYDLAWLPQPFVPPEPLAAGVRRVHRALRPDRWIVLPLVTTQGDDPFERALMDHTAHLLGGGPVDVPAMTAMLEDAGFVDAEAATFGTQVVIRARRP